MNRVFPAEASKIRGETGLSKLSSSKKMLYVAA